MPSRPEDLLPPDLYYNDTSASKYTSSSRIKRIQAQMTHRALSLLSLTRPSFILDVGCGSGLSGEILSEAGHAWVGMDISPSMLDVAVQRRERALRKEEKRKGRAAELEMDVDMNGENQMPTPPEEDGDVDGAEDKFGGFSGDEVEDEDEDVDDNENDEDDEDEDLASLPAEETVPGPYGDLLLSDMGQGLPYRPGTFDACISISAIQWLCTSSTSHSSDTSSLRLRRFFDTLYVSLRRGGKAVLQFYPRSIVERDMVSKAAVKAGFGAGLLVDEEGSKNEKVYLVLSVGGGDITGTVSGMDNMVVEERMGREVRDAFAGRKKAKGSKREEIRRTKERLRLKGRVVKEESKYTGRKRRVKF